MEPGEVLHLFSCSSGPDLHGKALIAAYAPKAKQLIPLDSVPVVAQSIKEVPPKAEPPSAQVGLQQTSLEVTKSEPSFPPIEVPLEEGNEVTKSEPSFPPIEVPSEEEKEITKSEPSFPPVQVPAEEEKEITKSEPSFPPVQVPSEEEKEILKPDDSFLVVGWFICLLGVIMMMSGAGVGFSLLFVVPGVVILGRYSRNKREYEDALSARNKKRRRLLQQEVARRGKLEAGGEETDGQDTEEGPVEEGIDSDRFQE